MIFGSTLASGVLWFDSGAAFAIVTMVLTGGAAAVLVAGLLARPERDGRKGSFPLP